MDRDFFEVIKKYVILHYGHIIWATVSITVYNYYANFRFQPWTKQNILDILEYVTAILGSEFIVYIAIKLVIDENSGMYLNNKDYVNSILTGLIYYWLYRMQLFGLENARSTGWIAGQAAIIEIPYLIVGKYLYN
jgi:hypothetical protein